MRTVLTAIAMGVLTCSSAAASSFITIGEATPPATSSVAATTPSPSVIVLGEPIAPEPIASIPARPLDGTETASIADPRADAAPRAGGAVAEAAAEWARISSAKTQSVLYVGQPDFEAIAKEEKKRQTVAVFDARKVPMVMRGGIFGDLGALPASKDEKPVAASAPATDTKLSRRERLDKEKAAAKAAAEAAATPLAPGSNTAPVVKR